MKKRILAFFLLVSFVVSLFVPFSAIAETEENVLIASDDFSDGMSGWSNDFGDDFFVLNSRLNVSAKNSRHMSIAASDISIDNGIIELTMNIKSGEYFAVLPRYVDDSTYYAFKFYPSKSTVILQKRVNGGSFTDIRKARLPIIFGNDYRVKIMLNGTEMTLFVDSAEIMKISDESIAAGRLAFGADDAVAYADDIALYSLPESVKVEEAPVKESKKIYVSPDGNDETGNGSEEYPYATITKAKSIVAGMRKGKDVIEVIFKEGVYHIDKMIEFTAEDSGTKNAVIRYKAEDGAHVVISGGKQIDVSRFTTVDEQVSERLRRNVRDKVLQVDLSRQGFDRKIIDFVARAQVGNRTKFITLALNHRMQSLARWPNTGYEVVGECDNSVPPKLFYTNSIPSRWAEAKNFFIDGYLFHDWAPEFALVDNVDTLSNSINFKSRTAYGVRSGGKWAAVNLLEELDVPGEWYIDFDKMIMYYYPPKKLTQDDLLEIGYLSGYLMQVSNTQNIEFEGIHFTMNSGNNGTAILVNGDASNVTIRNCIIDNVTRNGIVISAENITVDGCIIHNVGEMAVSLENCGDMTNLIDCNVVIKNNDISNTSLYQGGTGPYAIGLSEQTVGAVIRNNVFHDIQNAAIRYRGLGHKISYNEIYNCLTEAADAGAIYSGRSWNYYGTVIDHNFFHDLGQKNNTSGYAVASVFWDDINNGGEFSYNISVPGSDFKTRGTLLGGGSDNIAIGNTAVGAEQGISSNTRRNHQTYEEWEEYAYGTAKYGTYPIQTEPYVKRFPKMATVLDRIKENGGIFKRENILSDNLNVDCVTPINLSHEMTIDADLSRNVALTDVDDLFVDPENLDYRVRKDAKVKYGISDEILDEDFDLDLIGIQTPGKREMDPKMMDFHLMYPADGDTTVTQDRTVLVWSEAYLGDRYTYTVSDDPEFKNIVAQDYTIKTSATLEGLELGKTYYWKVTAHNLSRQYGCDADAPEGVWSFTVDKNSPLDLSSLKLSVSNAEKIVKTMKEGNKPGEYRIGATKALKEKIKLGNSYLAQTTGDQKEIDNVVYEINRSLTNLEGYVNAGYTTLNLTPTSQWVTWKSAAEKTTITKNNGQIKFDLTSSTLLSLDETLSNYNVMCFKTKIDSFKDGSWFAYGLRASDTNTNIWSQEAYYILVKEDIFELQKAGKIYKTAPNNGKFKAGTWHDVKFGSITTENGINMYFELDGEVILDFLDKSTPNKRPGMFVIHAAISGNNSVELAPADTIPQGLYMFSDEILREINVKAMASGTLNIDSEGYGQKGTWTDSTTLFGHENTLVRTSVDSNGSITWSMNSGKEGNKKLYRVYYYHIPTANGDKNVKVNLSGYNGEYDTTIDLSQGTAGWVELGTFEFMAADYNGRLDITFTGSGEGEINLSNVKFEITEEGENLLK